MADRIDEGKYKAMIWALETFASKVSTASTELQSLAGTCAQSLSEEDKAIAPIYQQVRKCQEKYGEAATEARRIAGLMQGELEEQRKEDQVWAED